MARNAAGMPVWRAYRWPILVAVALFLLADIALVAFTLHSVNGSQSAPRPASTSWLEAQPAPVASSTPRPVTVPTVASTRIISALDGDVAWRASTGACAAEGAKPELTTDGGATWTATDAGAATGITALQSISVSGEATASFIGFAAEDCAPQYIRTFVGGDDFATYDDDLDGSWYFSAALLHAPGGEAPAPCPSLVSLAPNGEVAAAAMCEDGTVHITNDRAATWADATVTGSPVAITGVDGGYAIAIAGSLYCAGVQLDLVDNGGATTSTACLPLDSTPEQLAGTVAITEAGGTIWLWAEEFVSLSTDGGISWSQR